jgi:tRNA threonylcarbamoyladenosine biosynthesis protein TsaB
MMDLHADAMVGGSGPGGSGSPADGACLAIETSTERLSVALFHAGRLQVHEGPGGARASAQLLPVIHGLLRGAQLQARDLSLVVFGSGPGSFTGLRTACAVAQGLAFGAGIPVLPVGTLMAVAEDLRHREGVGHVLALLDARMEEVYVCPFIYRDGTWHAPVEAVVCAPEALAQALGWPNGLPEGWVLAGSLPPDLAERLPGGPVRQAAPSAEALLRLVPALRAAGQTCLPDDALPVYVRDKVARTTAERLADRAPVV